MISRDPKILTFQTPPALDRYQSFLTSATTTGTASTRISVLRNGEPVTSPNPAITITCLVVGFIVATMVIYTFQLLLALVAIESPPGIRLPTSTDEEDQHTGGTNPTSTTSESRADNSTTTTSDYITSSIRSTLRHLRKEGGFFSPWRGFAVYLVLGIIIVFWSIVVVTLVRLIVPDPPPKFLWVESVIAGIISAVVASRVALVWTHVRIAAPKPNIIMESCQRITWAHAVQTVPATLLAYATAQLPFVGFEPDKPNQDFGFHPPPPRLIAQLSVAFITAFLLGVPTNIVLTRIQVSILPDDRTIIPCDKTFGVEDLDIGTSLSTIKALTIKQAIKTLDHSVLKRGYLLSLKTLLVLGVAAFQIFCLWILLTALVG